MYNTFKEDIPNVDLMRLKFFPLTLKNKAKIWLNSLRLRTISNWGDMQTEKREIYTFTTQENEKFYQCWERYLETISACPHHGFDTWMLVNHLYNGMSPVMKQLLKTMCGGDFMSKHPEEAMDFLNYVAETAKAWDEPNLREAKRMRPAANSRGGMYSITEGMEVKAKLSTLARRLEELEIQNHHEVRAVTEASMPNQPCFICQSTEHQGEHCLIVPSVRDMMDEHANVVGQYKPPTTAPYGNTYNLNWRNHPVTEASMPNQPCFICQSTEHQGEHCLIVPSVRDMMAEHANVVGQYKPPTTAPYGNTYNPNWRNHPNLS